MPITLEQSKVGMADKIDQTIIDNFRRASFILDRLTFDNSVSPGTGGSTLVYGYMQLKTPSVAAGRAINSEYTPGEALKGTKFANLKIFGGAFEVDRVIEGTAARSEIAFQFDQKTKATANKFHYDFINGDATGGLSTEGANKPGDGHDFDGLDALLTDASTEYTPREAIDLTTQANVKANAEAFAFELDQWLGTLSAKPEMLLMNSKMKTVMKAVARAMGYYSRNEDAFGRGVDYYDGIELRDMGEYFDGEATKPCVPIEADGTTAIYAATFGLDAIHAASPAGEKIIHVYKPNLEAPGAVKKGEVEMVAAIVLKDTTKAGVFRNIKVAAVGAAG